MIIKLMPYLLAGLFVFSSATEADAQRRSRSSTREKTESRDRRGGEDKESIKDKLAYDIFLGTLGFNRGFSVSTKLGAGYKIIDPLTAGVGTKLAFAFFNELGTANDATVFNFAFFPYLRYRIGEQFYLKGENNFFSRDLGTNDPNSDNRVNFQFPMAGGGYVQGFDDWKFGIEVMFLLDDDVVFSGLEKSDLYTFIEYNISFLYNL